MTKMVQHQYNPKTSNDYWIGPHGIRVPHEIKSIPSDDRVNNCLKPYGDGNYAETEVHCEGMDRLTKEEYLLRTKISFLN